MPFDWLNSLETSKPNSS